MPGEQKRVASARVPLSSARITASSDAARSRIEDSAPPSRRSVPAAENRGARPANFRGTSNGGYRRPTSTTTATCDASRCGQTPATSARRNCSAPTGASRRGTSAARKIRAMDTDPVDYWNAQARDYDENIFSTIDEDSTGVIAQTIARYAAVEAEGPAGRCIDLGCGAGKYLPVLAASFRDVCAVDLSPKLTSLAKQEVKSRDLRNVSVRVRDLSKSWHGDRKEGDVSDSATVNGGDVPESYGFAVMANVLIAPGPDALRVLMLRNAWHCLCVGGRLLAVVPSLESALYVNMRCEEAQYEGPYAVGKRSSGDSDALRQPTRGEGADILHGVLKRSGVRTKHYLEVEFCLLAQRVGFQVESCDKVTYAWRSELGLYSDLHLPGPLREPSPLPWDWLFLLRKSVDVNTCSPSDSRLRQPLSVKDEREKGGAAAGTASIQLAAEDGGRSRCLPELKCPNLTDFPNGGLPQAWLAKSDGSGSAPQTARSWLGKSLSNAVDYP